MPVKAIKAGYDRFWPLAGPRLPSKSSFRQFVRLPLEIRRMIWHEAVQSCFQAVRQRMHNQSRIWVIDDYQSDQHCQQPLEMKSYLIKYYRQILVLLAVHQESRVSVLSACLDPEFCEHLSVDHERRTRHQDRRHPCGADTYGVVMMDTIQKYVDYVILPDIDIRMHNSTVRDSLTLTDGQERVRKAFRRVAVPLEVFIGGNGANNLQQILQLANLGELLICVANRNCKRYKHKLERHKSICAYERTRLAVEARQPIQNSPGHSDVLGTLPLRHHEGEKIQRIDLTHRTFNFVAGLRKREWEHFEKQWHMCQLANVRITLVTCRTMKKPS